MGALPTSALHTRLLESLNVIIPNRLGVMLHDVPHFSDHLSLNSLQYNTLFTEESSGRQCCLSGTVNLNRFTEYNHLS